MATSPPANPKPEKPAKGKDSPLIVKVFSPYEIYFQGEAKSVSALNKTGPFDVLSGHANFFSLLVSGDVMVRTDRDEFKFPINHGVVKVTDNAVSLFVNV